MKITFEEWLKIGIENEWVIPPVCYSHDGIPTSADEQQQFEIGFDPCVHIMRVCDPDDWQDIYDNTTSMQWRDTK